MVQMVTDLGNMGRYSYPRAISSDKLRQKCVYILAFGLDLPSHHPDFQRRNRCSKFGKLKLLETRPDIKTEQTLAFMSRGVDAGLCMFLMVENTIKLKSISFRRDSLVV